jgi:hypothetical protein
MPKASIISVRRASDVSQTSISRRLVWLLLVAGTIANAVGIAGGSWDAAYHTRFKVDTFFSPPHLVIYGGILGTMLVGLAVLAIIMVERRARGDWIGLLARRPLLVLPLLANLGFLATGPFDDLWHRAFGRDQLTPWTVPHAILLLNLAATAVAVAGLALWLRAPDPAGDLAPPADRSSQRRAGIMLFVGLSMVITHMWPFVAEWEHGGSFGNPIIQFDWVYPPLAALNAAVCLTLAAGLLPNRWWLPLLLVVTGQLWRTLPGWLLVPFGYANLGGLTITLSLAGLSYGLIAWLGRSWQAWARYAIFGLSYLGMIVVARALGELPTLTTADLALTAPLLPVTAVLGGVLGGWLAGWLQHMAGEQ